MENEELFAHMSSKGPWYSAELKVCCMLSRRCVSRGGYSLKDVQGRLANDMASHLGENGLPSERIVREWERTTPDFPEQALRDGMITQQNIPSWLRPYLRIEGFHVDLRQEIPSAAQGDSTLGVGQTIVAGVAAVYVIKQLFKKRPPRQGFRLTGRR